MLRTLWGLVIAGLFLGSGVANAQVHMVRDDLNLFSADAKDKANKQIAYLKTKLKKDLVIETRAAPKLSEGADKAKIDDEITKWAVDQFRQLRVDGVYVVITENPNKVRVIDGNSTRRNNWFSQEEATRLQVTVAKLLKEKKADEALSAITTRVVSAMDLHVPAAGAAPPRPANGHGPAHHSDGGLSLGTILIWGIGIFLVFWLIRALIRAATGGGAMGSPGYGYGGGGYGGGGGGFFPSLMGGLFGAAAGMWMYNSFFGGGSSSAWGAGPSGPNPSQDPADTDGSGTSEGGDWGGGDAGGGGGNDWNGGDAGGGGGDWGGGGGGDWGGGGGGDFGGGGGGDW